MTNTIAFNNTDEKINNACCTLHVHLSLCCNTNTQTQLTKWISAFYLGRKYRLWIIYSWRMTTLFFSLDSVRIFSLANPEIGDYLNFFFFFTHPLCERKGKSLICLISGLNLISEDSRKAVVWMSRFSSRHQSISNKSGAPSRPH